MVDLSSGASWHCLIVSCVESDKFSLVVCSDKAESWSPSSGLFFSPYVHLQLFKLIFHVVQSKLDLETVWDLTVASIRDHDQLFLVATIAQGCFCLNKNYM